jgi:hypothetical protein
MDQAVSLMAQPGVALHVQFNPVSSAGRDDSVPAGQRNSVVESRNCLMCCAALSPVNCLMCCAALSPVKHHSHVSGCGAV